MALNKSSNESSLDAFQSYLYLEDHYGWMVLTTVVLGTSAVLGTLGNILTISAVWCVRALRTSGNVFIVNLALADMVVTVLVDPFNVVGAVAGRRVLVANPVLCEWVASFCAPACMSAMWNMSAISLNRYVLICKPHLYPRIFTFKSSVLYCVGIWILAHLIHMPSHLGWGHNRFSYEYYICTFDTYTRSFGVFFTMIGIFLPLIGVVFGYSAIFLKVKSVKTRVRLHRQKMAASVTAPVPVAGQSQQKAKGPEVKLPKPVYVADDVKLAKMLFTTFIVWCILWLPFGLFVLAGDPDEIPRLVYVTAILLVHGSSAVNPILYGLMNKHFRDGYCIVLGLNRGVVGDKSMAARPIVASGNGILPASVVNGPPNSGTKRDQVSIQVQDRQLHP